jgi:3-deoxy-D-manno-octulosonate 8-phosphate phosphatase (KDO 8-P phosphatase)
VIELIVLDVDGCLTDGKITYSNKGDETKSFSVKDGLAITSWIRMGKKVAIITGRKSEIVDRRAKELGVSYLYQGIKDKRSKLDEIMQKESLSLDNIAIMGDDLNDYKMLQAVKCSYAPSDAAEDIKKIVGSVTDKKGGDGAVRWMIDDIIQKDNLKKEFLDLWL